MKESLYKEAHMVDITDLLYLISEIYHILLICEVQQQTHYCVVSYCIVLIVVLNYFELFGSDV